MEPLPGLLALRGWGLYVRVSAVHGMRAERWMLLEEASQRTQPTGQTMHRMVMGWPEVMNGANGAIIQRTSAGEVFKYCNPRGWNTIRLSLLEILAAPILAE